MKNRIIAVAVVAGGLGLAGLVALKADSHGPGGHHPHHGPKGNPLDHITKELNLTPDQQARVAPIVEQAKPQIEAIHREAMEKMRGVMEGCAAQIRPLLTPEQQQKLDAIKKAHEDMHKAQQELHDAERM